MTNTPDQFITLLNEPVDEHHRYVLEVATGTNKQTYTGIQHAWAYVRRRIVQYILKEAEDGELVPSEKELWATTGLIVTTDTSTSRVAKFIDEQLQVAKRRIPIVRKNVANYVQRNEQLSGHMLNGELSIKIAQSQMFTREELKAALLQQGANAS